MKPAPQEKKMYKCKEIINVLVKCAFSASVCCYDILNLNSPRVWNNLVLKGKTKIGFFFIMKLASFRNFKCCYQNI